MGIMEKKMETTLVEGVGFRVVGIGFLRSSLLGI